MTTIKMRSSAAIIKGQGVGSCFHEQVRLVSEGLESEFRVVVNGHLKSEIVHYHTVNPDYYFERFFNKDKVAAIGYVHFLPDTLEDSLTMPGWLKKIFYKYLISFYNSMDYLVTVNPAIAKKLKCYGVDNPKIVYIPNFVSEEEFYVQDEKKTDETKSKYALPKDQFIVMGVGQLQTRKGILDFVRTAEALPHVQFIWAGGFSFGMITNGYDDIKAIRANPPANLKFLGMIDRDEMVDLYNASDLMFLPSYDELFPMAILEAICCKKPVLLRNIEIYEDILFDCYLSGSSVEEFTEAIDKLHRDKESYKYWRDKAWDCHVFYSRENILALWRRLYREAYAKSTHSIFLAEGNV